MTNTNWTKGPYKVKEGDRHTPYECDLKIIGDIFVIARLSGPNYAHCRANFDLFAAAPALYDTLDATLSLLEYYSIEGQAGKQIRAKIEAAMAQARGECDAVE